jgi:uncharacterized protein (TIGR02145 family)
MISNYAKAYGAYVNNIKTGASGSYYLNPADSTQTFYSTSTRACASFGYAETATDAIAYLGDSGHNTVGSIRNCGYLYSWYGATAGTGTGSTTSNIADDSICPTGWHLPSAGNVGTAPTGWASTAEFGDLYSSLGSSAKMYGPNSAFRVVRSGYAYPNNYLHAQGSNGYYWSSSAYSSASDAYNLNSAGTVNPANNLAKYYGIAVRCVLNVN